MASASPSALLAVSDRPVVERLEAKGAEVPGGEFAGLMGQLVNPPATAKPGEAPPTSKPMRSKGPKAPVEKPQLAGKSMAQGPTKGLPVPAPALEGVASGPAGSAASPVAPEAAAPPAPESPVQSPEAPTLPLATRPGAPLVAMAQIPAGGAEAPAPTAPQPVTALPLDFSAAFAPVPAPVAPQQGGTVPADKPPASSSAAPLAAQGIPRPVSLPLPAANSPLLQAPPTTPFSMPGSRVPQAPQAELLRPATTPPAAPEGRVSPEPSQAATPAQTAAASPTPAPLPGFTSPAPGLQEEAVASPLQQTRPATPMVLPDPSVPQALQAALLRPAATAPAAPVAQVRTEGGQALAPAQAAVASPTPAQFPSPTNPAPGHPGEAVVSPLQQTRPATPMVLPDPSVFEAPQPELLRPSATAPAAPVAQVSTEGGQALAPAQAAVASPTPAPFPSPTNPAPGHPGEAVVSPLQQTRPATPMVLPDPSVFEAPQPELLRPAATAPAGPEARVGAERNQAPAAPAPAPGAPLQAALLTFASQPTPPAPIAAGATLPQPMWPSSEGRSPSGLRPDILSSTAEPQAPAAASVLNAPPLTRLPEGPPLPHTIQSLPATLVVSSAPILAAANPEPVALPQLVHAPVPALAAPNALPTAVPATLAAEEHSAPVLELPSAPSALPLPAGAANPPQGGDAAPGRHLLSAPPFAPAQAALAEPSPRMKNATPAGHPLQTLEAVPSEEPVAAPKATSAESLQEARRELFPSASWATTPTGSSASGVAPEGLPGRAVLDAPTSGSAAAELPELKAAKQGPSASLRVQDGSPLAALSALRTMAEPIAPAAQTATAPPAPPSAPALQLEGGLKWMLKGGAQEAQLQLHPESLGQVTIHLKVEGGEVHVRLWVTDPTSMQAVRDGQGHLGASLKEQGLQLGSFDLQQGHRPFQEAPVAPVLRETLLPERSSTRQEAPAVARPAILNPHHVELYA